MKETRQKRVTYCIISLYDILEKAKIWGQKSLQWLPGTGDGEKEWTTKRHKATYLDDGNILHLNRGSGYTVPFVKRQLKGWTLLFVNYTPKVWPRPQKFWYTKWALNKYHLARIRIISAFCYPLAHFMSSSLQATETVPGWFLQNRNLLKGHWVAQKTYRKGAKAGLENRQ